MVGRHGLLVGIGLRLPLRARRSTATERNCQQQKFHRRELDEERNRIGIDAPGRKTTLDVDHVQLHEVRRKTVPGWNPLLSHKDHAGVSQKSVRLWLYALKTVQTKQSKIGQEKGKDCEWQIPANKRAEKDFETSRWKRRKMLDEWPFWWPNNQNLICIYFRKTAHHTVVCSLFLFLL